MPKINLNISDGAFAFLKGRKKAKNITATQTIEQALSVYKHVLLLQEQGGKLCYEDPQGRIEGLRFI